VHTYECPSYSCLLVGTCTRSFTIPQSSPTLPLSCSLFHFQPGIWAYHGSTFAFDQALWSPKWCFGEQDSFIEGIQLPGDVSNACAGGTYMSLSLCSYLCPWLTRTPEKVAFWCHRSRYRLRRFIRRRFNKSTILNFRNIRSVAARPWTTIPEWLNVFPIKGLSCRVLCLLALYSTYTHTCEHVMHITLISLHTTLWCNTTLTTLSTGNCMHIPSRWCLLPSCCKRVLKRRPIAEMRSDHRTRNKSGMIPQME